ncbi:MAG: hypothetical protein GY820_35520 [Gammaproteobacteria bacterium]|nr:hypothetical protein [Gammaproteobacteria bacterium]
MTEKAKYRSRYFRAPFVSIERSKGLIFKRQETVTSESQVDLEEYAIALATAYNDLEDDGYDPVSVVPLNMGGVEFIKNEKGHNVGEVGYSVTCGAVVVGKLRDSGE